MTWFNLSAMTRAHAMGGARISASKSLDIILGKMKEVVSKVLPTSEIGIGRIKEEVWGDLSAIYCKYEDEDQKSAFREVMYEI